MMKRSELTKIKALTIKELLKKTVTLQGELNDLVMDKNMGKLKDLKSVFKKRKDMAKVLTVLRQKQMIDQLSVLNDQLSDKGQSVVSSFDQQKTGGKK